MYKNDDSCLEKAANDEPIFVLRAQDKLAPVLVRLWADLAMINGCGDEKTVEARTLAHLMEMWQKKNRSKFPD